MPSQLIAKSGGLIRRGVEWQAIRFHRGGSLVLPIFEIAFVRVRLDHVA
jgi:hypothetical protein